MRVIFCLLAALLLWGRLALAETTCPALREIAQDPQPVYIVRCSKTEVAITAAEFNTGKSKGGQMQQHCPAGEDYFGAGTPMRWQTASGLPETCQVFSAVRGVPVRAATYVSFRHADGYEEEIDTRVHALVYNGNTLVNFDPPVPGIVVEP